MNIKQSEKHFKIFLGFFTDKMDQIKKEPEMTELLYAQYIYDNKEKFCLTDFEVGYIAGSSFMGVLESFQKTMEILAH